MLNANRLILISLFLVSFGLGTFFLALRSQQYDDHV
ncbi:MAG: cbb3-type cytochrome oxidase assembly protein CcoS [Paracoccaceae bacterium]